VKKPTISVAQDFLWGPSFRFRPWCLSTNLSFLWVGNFCATRKPKIRSKLVINPEPANFEKTRLLQSRTSREENPLKGIKNIF